MTARSGPDRCPGVLRLHEASDGALARVRVPGGVLSLESLTGLLWSAECLGDSHLEVTSRGNVQLRGVVDVGKRLAESLTAYGFLPNPDLELARTILISPLSGLDGAGLRDVTEDLQALDARICAENALADLSGRFAFGLDDGRGDVLGLALDLTAVAVDPEHYTIVVAGTPTGLIVHATALPAMLVDAAAYFVGWSQELGRRLWRIEEAPDGVDAVIARLASDVGAHPWDGQLPPVALPPEPGLRRHDGRTHLVVAMPWGRAKSTVWRLLGDVAGVGGLRVTPWNTVVLTDLADPEAVSTLLSAEGLHPQEGTVWARVSACAGGQGCARTERQVRIEAENMITSGSSTISELELTRAHSSARVHWSGCERRCGHPRLPYRDLVAVEGGWAAEDR